MMKRKQFSSAMIGGIFFLIAGCVTPPHVTDHRSAQEAYARLDFDAAVSAAAKSLRSKPDFRPSQELLSQVYPKAVESHLDKIKEAQSSNAKFRWDSVVSDYTKLIQLSQEVKSLPALTDKKTKQPILFDARDYGQNLAEAKSNAAEAHYQEGQRLFGKEGMANRDNAANEFTAANSYVSNYKDASALAAEGYYQEGRQLSGREGVANRDSAARAFSLANKFVSNYKDASALAAEGYYKEGILLAKKSDDIEVQKQAAKMFKTALEYVPAYKDAAILYEGSRVKGVKRIAIIPFQNKSGRGNQFGAVADIIVDAIVSGIMNDQSTTEFLEIISRSQLEQILQEHRLTMEGITDPASATKAGKILAVHEILTGQITQIAVTPERTTERSTRENAEAVIGMEKYIDNKGNVRERPIWGEVVASVIEYNRTAGASISGSCTLIEVETGRVKNSHQLNGSFGFEDTWATFSGDARALSETSKKLIAKPEPRPPVETEMVNSALQRLISSLSSTLKQDVR